MTRHQRRKVAAERAAKKVERLASAAIAARNSAIIARNIGALRNGARFETSGALAPRAYRYEGASSEAARVVSNIDRHRDGTLSDKGHADFVRAMRNKHAG